MSLSLKTICSRVLFGNIKLVNQACYSGSVAVLILQNIKVTKILSSEEKKGKFLIKCNSFVQFIKIHIWNRTYLDVTSN